MSKDPKAQDPPPPREPPPSVRAAGLSIYQKLLALILTLLVGVISVLAVYLPARQIAGLRGALESKAETYGRLASKELEPAVAFNDIETAREVFASLAQDHEVESLALLDAEGHVLHASGSSSLDLSAYRTGLGPHGLVTLEDRVAVVTPVVSLEGPRGTLVIELSTRRLSERQSEIHRDALAGGLCAFALGALGAFFIARSLARRLRVIANVAEKVAAGELDQPELAESGRDEIGTVTIALNAMLKQIRALIAQIQTSARREKEELEHLVLERTRALDTRNDDMRRILEKIGQGFLTVQMDGSMSSERSAVLEQWFGPAPASGSFADYLKTVDARVGEWFALGWDSVVDGYLPADVTLDQLPKKLSKGPRHYELSYRPIVNQWGDMERALVVISDVTAERERARAEADERELTGVFTRFIADRRGFAEFVSSAETMVEALTHSGDAVGFKRTLHTLKGNAGIYGLGSIATLCHQVETEVAETGDVAAQSVERVTARWNVLANKMRLLSRGTESKLQIDDADYEEVLAAIERGSDRDRIRDLLLGWKLELAQAPLTRLAEHAKALAQRLNKAPIAVRVVADRVRLDPARWSDFWSSAIHVLRNAVDHGIENAEQRASLGKPSPAQLTLRARVIDLSFTIEISDDGRGIDWGAVAKRARELGLRFETQAELLESLFADGLSTCTNISEVSGRGIGLGAVRAACRALGGSVEVDSAIGVGTTFRFVWPATVLAATAPMLPHARSSSDVRRIAGPKAQ